MRGRIKVGVAIVQDYGAWSWPECRPPLAEYAGEPYQCRTKFPDTIFDVTWVSTGGANGYWRCKAHGYGANTHSDEAYGNGSIFVRGYDNIEVIIDE